MEKTLTHVRLLVEDYQACFRFYRDVMEFHVAWGNESTRYAEFRTGDVRLAVFDRDEMARVVGRMELPSACGCKDEVTVIFRVPNVDDEVKNLRGKKIQFVTEPLDRPDWGIRTAHLRDPDGNLIELNCRLDRQD
jgi:catechol 2,3-dioxygenase-like lactoylglutathione lyase family enzyme